MSQTSNPAVSNRIEHCSQSRAKGQRRHDMREGPQPKYIDPSRTKHNSILMEPTKEAALNKLCEKRAAQLGRQRARKSTAAIATCGIVTFSKQAQTIVNDLSPDEQDRRLLKTAQDLADAMGTTLEGAVVHRDETALHMHYRLAAVRIDGRPISKVVDTSKLQDVAAEAWSDLGISRGVKKSIRQARGEPTSAWVNRSVKELHENLPKEIEQAKAQAAEAETKARQAAERLEQAQAKANEANREVDRLNKRVTTYEKRLAKAQEELEQARAEIERLAGEAELPRVKTKRFYDEGQIQFGRFSRVTVQGNPRSFAILDPKKTPREFAKLQRQANRAKEQAEEEGQKRKEAEEAARRLQEALIQPIVAPGPFKDHKAALWASRAAIQYRYQVYLQIYERIARVVEQEGLTARQIAAALYSVGRDKGWENMWFSVSDKIAKEVIKMAGEDDCLDRIEFRSESAQALLEAAQSERAKERALAREGKGPQDAEEPEDIDDPLGPSPPIPSRKDDLSL